MYVVQVVSMIELMLGHMLPQELHNRLNEIVV